MITVNLPFMPTVAPRIARSRARNQLTMSGVCERRLRATCFIGSSRGRGTFGCPAIFEGAGPQRPNELAGGRRRRRPSRARRARAADGVQAAPVTRTTDPGRRLGVAADRSSLVAWSGQRPPANGARPSAVVRRRRFDPFGAPPASRDSSRRRHRVSCLRPRDQAMPTRRARRGPGTEMRPRPSLSVHCPQGKGRSCA